MLLVLLPFSPCHPLVIICPYICWGSTGCFWLSCRLYVWKKSLTLPGKSSLASKPFPLPFLLFLIFLLLLFLAPSARRPQWLYHQPTVPHTPPKFPPSCIFYGGVRVTIGTSEYLAPASLLHI